MVKPPTSLEKKVVVFPFRAGLLLPQLKQVVKSGLKKFNLLLPFFISQVIRHRTTFSFKVDRSLAKILCASDSSSTNLQDDH